MSFIEPNLGQAQQNKKILQELEEKKRRMRSNTASPIQSESSLLNFQSNTTNQNLNQPETSLQQQPLQRQQQQQQPSASFYNTNTFGYFINTESTFGNQILPVLPRI